MRNLWSAALAAAIVIALPAVGTARSYHAPTEYIRAHSDSARHHPVKRHSAKARHAGKTMRSASARRHGRHVVASRHAHRNARIAAKRRHGGQASKSFLGRTIARGVSGLVTPLATKVSQIVSSCGSRVTSAVRHTRVAGTGRISLHASGQAADIQGNPSCIYKLLSGWPGGYSTDYGRVRHVHVSYGGREHGVRFAHGGHSRSRHAARRYASYRG
jgi:hypothetical protein